MRHFVFFLFTLSFLNLYAQNWETYQSLNNVTNVTLGKDSSIWMCTYSGIVQIKDDSVTHYDNLNGDKPFIYEDIETDKEGKVWVAADEGFAVFDGLEWSSLSLPPLHWGMKIYDIEIDTSGNIWLGFEAARKEEMLCMFDGENWIRYDVPNKENNLNDRSVYCVAADKDDNVWVGTMSGVSVFDGENWTSYNQVDGLLPGRVVDIETDYYGNTWFGSTAGLSVFDGVDWTSFTVDSGLVSNDVKKIVVHRDSSVWIATGQGISIFKDEQWMNYNQENLLFDQNINDICIGMNDVVLAATHTGLYSYVGMQGSVMFHQDEGLVNNSINDIEVDSLNHLWIATGGGISVFNDDKWINYDLLNGLDAKSVTAICIDKYNNKWIATGNGVFKYDGENWGHYTMVDGIISNNVSDIAIDSNSVIWIATDKGISRFENSTWSSYTTDQGLLSNKVKTILIDDENNKWFGTSIGISRFNDQDWTNFTPSTSFGRQIMCSESDAEGNLWFGTSYDGVWIYDGVEWEHLDTINGKECGWLYAISRDAWNNLWMGSFSIGGLVKYDGTNWTGFSSDDGLVDDNVNCISFDNYGKKWVGTVSKGISVLDDGDTIPYISVSSTEVTVDEPNGGSANLELTTNTVWHIDYDTSWITINQESGQGDATIEITVRANNSNNTRVGQIHIISDLGIKKTVFIYQAGMTTSSGVKVTDGISFFPNPVQNYLYIEESSSVKIHNVKVFNLLGKKVYVSDSKSRIQKIDLSFCSPGVYILNLNTSQGSQIIKILKQ